MVKAATSFDAAERLRIIADPIRVGNRFEGSTAMGIIISFYMAL